MKPKNWRVIHILFNGIISEDSISGGDQLILDLVKNIPSQIELVVILPEKARKYWDQLKLKNTKVYSLRNWFFDRSQNPLFVFLTYLRRAIISYLILKKEKNIQIIYSCSDVVLADILPAFFIKLGRKDVIWLSRNYHLILPPAKRQGNLLVNIISFLGQKINFWMMKEKSDKILALNNALKKQLIKHRFPKEKLSVLGAGVDTQVIKKHKIRKKYDYEAVVLGRIHPAKGIYDLVRIWALVVKTSPEYKLAVVGSGAVQHVVELRRRIRESKLEKNIDLLGFIPKEDVYDILKSAQVFLCPDHENGWGLAVCEAMASGLPVVSYNIDIFGSVYQKGFISVPLFDTKLFAEKIIFLLENKDERLRISQDARAQSEQYENKKVAATFLNLLKEYD